MAWTNALKQILSDRLELGVRENTKLPLFANTQYNDIIETANKVIVTKVGDATIGTYTPGTPFTYNSGAAGTVELTCDQYFFIAEKLDKTVKVIEDYIMAYMDKNLPNLFLKSDAYALSLATKANFPTNWIAGAADAAIEVNSANIIEQIEAMSEKLDEQNVPVENRMLVVPPKIMTLIKRAIRKSGLSFEGVNNVLFEGRATRILGFNIIESNQYVAASGAYKIFFGSPDVYIAGTRMPELEYFDKMQGEFAEAWQALIQFGIKVDNEKLGGVAFLKPVAEA